MAKKDKSLTIQQHGYQDRETARRGNDLKFMVKVFVEVQWLSDRPLQRPSAYPHNP